MTARLGTPPRITYDSEHGHVCTCSELEPFRDETGEAIAPNYRHTVEPDRTVEPTDSGSWLYVCKACGASAWSGL